ncbi:MAG: NifU family protein [Sandaracinaceae bacterium]
MSAPKREVSEAVKAMVSDVLSPLLGRDGGTIEVASHEGAVVTLRIGGAIVGCPGTAYIKRHVIEPAIKKAAGNGVEIVYERGF